MKAYAVTIVLAVFAVVSFAAFVITGFWPYVVLEGLFLLVYGAEVRRRYV